MCDLNILGTHIEASVLSSQNLGVTCTQKIARAKLERLHTVRLIQGDQKITSRHVEALTRLKDS
jgi:hypothetical protein